MDTNFNHEPEPTVENTTLLSIQTTAERLSISRSQVYQLIDAGRLRTVRIGRSVRIPLTSIRDFVTALQGDDRRTA